MVRAGYLPHMAWEACELGVFPDHVLVVLVHLGFLLRTLLLLRHVLQTAVGCCYTLVDIGVVLRAGISVWVVVQRFVALHLLAHRCSWSSMPFDSSWLVVVDVVASCSRRAAGEASSALHAR